MLRHPAVPYILPFGLFLAFLALKQWLPIPEAALYALWVAVLGTALLTISRPAIDLKLRYPLTTILLGVAVFFIWIGPDTLFPGYRNHWLFQNSIMGSATASISVAGRSDWFVLVLRMFRAIVIVAIVEELFWRGWLMRWLIKPDFRSVPLGAYDTKAFWITAALFAAEHGPYWDVGLVTGAIYNVWMVRTRSLGDLIWAHATTNACLCAYVLATHRWEYWM